MNYQTALQCAILSQDIYQNFSNIEFTGVSGAREHLIDEQATDTQLAILYQPANTLVFIVFRGSQKTLKDWSTNFNFGKTDEARQEAKPEEPEYLVRQRVQADLEKYDPYQRGSKAQMHKGFSISYLSVRDRIHQYLNDNNISEVIVTGHSLGGALATLCGRDIQYNFPEHAVSVYTFGSPKVGNAAFVRSYNQHLPNTLRFMYGRDVVTKVPQWWMGYHHVDKGYKLGPWFTWKILSRRIRDHRIANYIEALREKV